MLDQTDSFAFLDDVVALVVLILLVLDDLLVLVALLVLVILLVLEVFTEEVVGCLASSRLLLRYTVVIPKGSVVVDVRYSVESTVLVRSVSTTVVVYAVATVILCDVKSIHVWQGVCA